jgi:hypothetical protein
MQKISHRMRPSSLSFVLALIASSSFSQPVRTAIFEDANGKSSILFPTGYIGINTSGETLSGRMFVNKRLGLPKEKTIQRGSSNPRTEQDIKYFSKLPEGQSLNKPKVVRTNLSEIYSNKSKRFYPRFDRLTTYTAKVTQFEEEFYPVKTLSVKKYGYYANFLRDVNGDVIFNNSELKIISEKESIVDASNTANAKKQLVKTETERTPNPPFLHERYFTIYRDSVASASEVKKVIRQFTDYYDSTETVKIIKRPGRSYYGITITGGTAEGVTSIFKDRDLTIGSSLDLHFGWKALVFSPIRRCKTCKDEEALDFRPRVSKHFAIDYLTITAGYIGEKYSIIDKSSTTPFDSVVVAEKFRGRTLGIHYNILFSGNWIFGFGWNWQETNNFKSLTAGAIATRNSFYDSATATTKTIEVTASGKVGPLSKFVRRNLLFDIVYITPLNTKEFNLAINPYWRTVFDPGKKVVDTGGVGVYLINPASSKVVLGLFVEYGDVFDTLDSEEKDFSRLSFGVSVKRQFLIINSKQQKL